MLTLHRAPPQRSSDLLDLKLGPKNLAHPLEVGVATDDWYLDANRSSAKRIGQV